MNLERMPSSSTRVAVVTGTNRGIGFEIARQLTGRGIHVILTSRDETKGRLALQKLAEEGLSPGYHQLDVTDPDSIRRLRDFLDREHGRVDILVNSMCPGHARTAMGGSGAPRSVEEGADTAVWLATLPDDGPTGGFFRDRQPIPW